MCPLPSRLVPKSVNKDGANASTQREGGVLTVTREHVLCMPGIATPPCLVGDFVDFSAAVVALVESYSD
jgi:hypothetical protein